MHGAASGVSRMLRALRAAYPQDHAWRRRSATASRQHRPSLLKERRTEGRDLSGSSQAGTGVTPDQGQERQA